MNRIAALVLATALPCTAPAAEPGEARALYQRIQEIRGDAGKLLEAGGEANLRSAVARLQEALDLLATPDVAERAEGSMTLYGRNHDVRMDLMMAYAKLGDLDRAIEMLAAMQRYAWSPRIDGYLATDPAFAALRADPRYQALIARGAISERTFKSPAIATPYKERLTVEERIAGLSLYWAEAREHFAWFDHVPDLDWGAVYLEFLPKVMAAETTRDYYRVMMQLAPRLHDGHTNIYPPKELQAGFFARPPLRTRLVEQRVIVTEVDSESLRSRVRVGDEVVAIDGVAAPEYAERNVRPFASASTPQDLEVRMYNYLLLAGPADQPVKLRLRDASGTERDEQVARKGYGDVVDREPFQLRMLEGGIVYLPLEQFDNDGGIRAFKASLPRILEAKGLVLDLRRNGGGSSNVGYEILSYLVKGPIPTSPGLVRRDLGARRADTIAWIPDYLSGAPYDRPKGARFEGPVAVLAGPQTYSAAEDFLVSFDVLKRGPIVGEASGGSTGQPMTIPLPGGGMGRICAKRDTYPDGHDFVGRGIPPTIEVKPTVKDLREGRDAVLDRAIEALRPSRTRG